MIRKGAIWSEWFISCGGCNDSTPIESTVAPAHNAKLNGWKLTKDKGWICPRCVLAVKSQKP